MIKMNLKKLVESNALVVNEETFDRLKGNDYFELSDVCNHITSYASNKYGIDNWERKKERNFIKSFNAKRSEIVLNLASRLFKGKEIVVYQLENEEEYMIVENKKGEW